MVKLTRPPTDDRQQAHDPSRRWKHDGYSFRRNRHQVINQTSRHHAQALAGT